MKIWLIYVILSLYNIKNVFSKKQGSESASTPNEDCPNLQEFCNKTLYEIWRQELYQDYLATVPEFWRYQAQAQFKLTNGLALDFAVQKCKAKLTNLIYFRSGRHGPGISISQRH